MSKSTEELLCTLNSSISELRSLFILENQEILEKQKEKLLPKNSVKKTIYDFCDGTRLISDIAKEINKSNNYIRSYLSILRREGLIRKIEIEGDIYHEQIF